MQCPACQSTLRPVVYEGITIETCDACRGEWLDPGELLHVTRAREARFGENERRAVTAAAKITGVKLADADRDLRCPKCGDTTDAVNYGGDSGIVIDRCTGCGGIWLDADEMEKVQMLVEHWEDQLPDDLKKYAKRLRQVAADVEQRTCFNLAGIPFMNALVNGVIDLLER
ncbi:MAG: zf-TFIIB domain-containing protein [Phycisphaerae bacterium]|nr:zf-TFIIB domain-containing protein [Phycisphaerae bacterium]